MELARVINGVPRYLLLDEPGAGLDLSERQRLPGIIADLTAHGVGTLLVDHDMSLIARVCSRVPVLRQGELIFDGRPAEAFTDPQVMECYLGEVMSVLDALDLVAGYGAGDVVLHGVSLSLAAGRSQR
ncbi:hypothetical protein MRBLWH7_002369 [Microbacterium sp. LWH7-1.2]|uniref:ABC transporter ATP-binding protein C-terminal domain-containing protein n=1 Tax=Microbacterium sp. LWH7-1.2 TaxID=3135257 RepID=UPI003139E298